MNLLAQWLAKPYEIRSEKFPHEGGPSFISQLLWVSPGYRAAVLVDPDRATNGQ